MLRQTEREREQREREQRVEMGSYRMCVCFTRKYRVTEAEPPSDVKEAFNKYTEAGTHMNADQLRRFLVEVQAEGDGASLADAERIVEQVLHKRHPIAKFTRHTLTLDDFHHYLFSSEFNPPIRDQVFFFFLFLYLISVLLLSHHRVHL